MEAGRVTSPAVRTAMARHAEYARPHYFGARSTATEIIYSALGIIALGVGPALSAHAPLVPLLAISVIEGVGLIGEGKERANTPVPADPVVAKAQDRSFTARKVGIVGLFLGMFGMIAINWLKLIPKTASYATAILIATAVGFICLAAEKINRVVKKFTSFKELVIAAMQDGRMVSRQLIQEQDLPLKTQRKLEAKLVRKGIEICNE